MTRRDEVCDDCLTAAYDEGASDVVTRAQICTALGADIVDHTCEAIDEPTTRCDCSCHDRVLA